MKYQPSAVLAWLLLVAASIAAASLASAGVLVTETSGRYELRDAQNVPIRQYTTPIECAAVAATVPGSQCVNVNAHELRDTQSHVISRHDTHALCIEAASATPGNYKCLISVAVKVEFTCDDVPAPPPVIDAQNFRVLGTFAVHQCNDNTGYYFTQHQQVRDIALYPACWEERPVQVTGCIVPTAPIVWLNTPSEYGDTDSNPALVAIPDGPDNGTSQVPTIEPRLWFEGTDYLVGEPCPAEANCNCYPYVKPALWADHVAAYEQCIAGAS